MPKTKKTAIKKAKKIVVPIKSRTLDKAGIAKRTEKPPKESLRLPRGQAKVKKEKYFESLGRRKTAMARVRLFLQKEKSFLINEKSLEEYFPTWELQQTVSAPLNLMNCLEQFKVSVKVKGGGTVSQAESIRHGIARALVSFNPDFRKKLKKAGYLKRDPRMRERKKFGLKRARRAPQWSKR